MHAGYQNGAFRPDFIGDVITLQVPTKNEDSHRDVRLSFPYVNLSPIIEAARSTEDAELRDRSAPDVCASSPS
jgi:hypothetical protein